MVEFEKPSNYILNKEGIQIEQLRFQDLMNQDLLKVVNINESFTKFWLIFKTDTEESLKEIIGTLTHCKNFSQKIHTLIWNEH